MATTATLNGGPTGGLHATPTLIHSDNPPQEETCRVDSNSSFESGHEDHMQTTKEEPGEVHHHPRTWISSPTTCTGEANELVHESSEKTIPSSSSSSHFMDAVSLEATNSKKRRKQSRPVRIPASELLDSAGMPVVAGGGIPSEEGERLASATPREKAPGPLPSLKHEVVNELRDDEEDPSGSLSMMNSSLRPHHHHHHHHSRHHVPLNLSSRNENSSSGDETPLEQSSLVGQPHDRNNSSSENDKTELLAGQGTKDSPQHFNRISTSGSPSLPPSFSPGLFPLSTSSPFSSLFPGNVNIFSHHQHQQQLSLTTGSQSQHQSSSSNPGPARTPTSSSSSIGSNSGGIGGGGGGNNGSQQGMVMGSGLQNLPPHRIFNPEAYCDLCNKEFCNKYFLKTHKANKHGVYTETSPSLGMGQMIGPVVAAAAISSHSPSNTSFLTGTPILSSSGLNTSVAQQIQQTSNTITTSSSGCQQQQGSPLAGSVVGTTLGTLNKGAIEEGTSSEIPFSLAAFSMEKGAGNSNGSQRRESFCEICQKEFCNKYFLKRHKAKIHGIPIDGSSAGSGRSSSSSSHGKSSGGGGGHRSAFSNGLMTEGKMREGLSHSLREMGLETLGLELVTKHLEEANAAAGGGGSGVGREEGELSADECSRGGVGGGVMNPREGGKSPENIGESDENSSFKMSSHDLKLPQLGTVVNTENACQFCYREFSSKQLLCAHLVKKHRLLIPSSFPPFLLPFPSSLFSEDQADSAAAAAAAAAAGLLDNNGNATNAEADYECNLCNRSFQTIYLLRMHKSYFHPESEDATGVDTATSKFISDATASFLTAAANKPITNTTDDEGDNEQGYNSEHDSSGKASPTEADDNNKALETIKRLSTTVEMESRGEATSDSDELKRLQTMIMELNRVTSAAVAWSPPLETGSMPATSLASGSSTSTLCHICNKEFYSTFFLQQHIQHYHTSPSMTSTGSGQIGSEIRIKSESPHPTSVTPTMNAMGGESQHSIRIKSESLLQSEINSGSGGGGKKSYLSGDPTGSAISISQGTLKERLLHPDGFALSSIEGGNVVGPSSTFLTPGPKGNNNNTINKSDSSSSGGGGGGGSGAKRPSPSLSRSYCTICHKELCNKYFMRTHMLKMHGISIESSTGLGGVTCDICNKELCSKYFLKVHKQNTHGIVEDGPSPPNPSTPGPVVTQSPSTNFPLLASNSLAGLNLSTSSHQSSGNSEGNGPTSLSHHMQNSNAQQLDPSSLSLLSKDPGDLQNRYFCHYSEVCPFCGRRFRSPKWLKTHLQSDHGEEGRERWKSIEKTLNLSRRQQQHHQQKSSSGKSNCPSGQIKGSTPTSGSGSGGGVKSNPLLKTSGLTRDGNKCAFCNFSSGDMEVMKSHLIKDHGNQLTNRQAALSEAGLMTAASFSDSQSGMLLDPLTMLFQKMEGGSNKLYRCTYCPFTTSILVYLYAHERTHTGLGGSPVTSQLMGGADPSPTFQCPMCFHTFDQPEAFQQHLIGHQMSGVLAPFFTPTTSTSSAGRLGFLSSPSGLGNSSGGGGGSDPSQDPRALLSLPLLNGNAGENLYWALKNVPSLVTGKSNGDGANKSGDLHHDHHHEDEEEDEEESNEPAADLTTNARKRRKVNEEEYEERETVSSELKPRKRGKICHFRCSHCQVRFKSREECLSHIHQSHNNNRKSKVQQQQQHHHEDENDVARGELATTNITTSRRQLRKNFRCRKCKFASSTYQALVVHCKLHHSILRPTNTTAHVKNFLAEIASLSSRKGRETISTGTLTSTSDWKVGNLPEVRGIPQEGTVGDGEFLMQGFLLTSSEEESSNQSSGYFVPSLVYLPVREKVSQSIRVSFSLTPTS